MRSNPKSAPPPALRRLTKEDAKLALMGMATVISPRPLLVGVAAVRLGTMWTLDETESLFEELVEAGRLRPIGKEEQRLFGVQDGFVVAGVDLRK